jgi:hypothetical protein
VISFSLCDITVTIGEKQVLKLNGRSEAGFFNELYVQYLPGDLTDRSITATFHATL